MVICINGFESANKVDIACKFDLFKNNKNIINRI